MSEANILVIDDEETICNLIRDTLTEKGYSVTISPDGKKGIEILKHNYFDVIFLDLKMPQIDGLVLLEEIKQLEKDNVVIMITGYPSFETVKESLHLGAFDYITKPFNLDELIFTVKRAVSFRQLNLENKRLMEQLKEENIILEKKVLEKTQDLKNLYQELQAIYLRTIKAFIQAIEAREHYTYSHSENVTKYAVMIAKEMRLSTEEIDEIRRASELHDLGKIDIHDYTLTNPGKLTPQEWEEVRFHSLKGAEILKPLRFLDGVIELIIQHHERYDGKGYPYGLKGESIRLGARIMGLADAFATMISERSYQKKLLTQQEVIEEIKKNSGTQFDPRVVEAFLKIVDKL